MCFLHWPQHVFPALAPACVYSIGPSMCFQHWPQAKTPCVYSFPVKTLPSRTSGRWTQRSNLLGFIAGLHWWYHSLGKKYRKLQKNTENPVIVYQNSSKIRRITMNFMLSWGGGCAPPDPPQLGPPAQDDLRMDSGRIRDEFGTKIFKKLSEMVQKSSQSCFQSL